MTATYLRGFGAAAAALDLDKRYVVSKGSTPIPPGAWINSARTIRALGDDWERGWQDAMLVAVGHAA